MTDHGKYLPPKYPMGSIYPPADTLGSIYPPRTPWEVFTPQLTPWEVFSPQRVSTSIPHALPKPGHTILNVGDYMAVISYSW